jgi:hypothetical protein
MLTFEENTHTYRHGDKVVPSVTQLLGRLHSFGMVPADVLAAACARGTFVHTLCQFHDEGDLDGSSVGEYQGYLDAWVNFCDAYKAEWFGVELQGYSERYGYAGTMDRYGVLNGSPFVIDIKTSLSSHPVWNMQLTAYRQLLAETVDAKWALARLGTVQLRPDGTYKLIEWSDPDAWPAFLALISLINWSTKS